MTGPLLIATVAAVGVLHTLVPDHWAPIVVVARTRKWSPRRTAGAAAIAGVGHVTSTLVLGLVAWIVGATAASHYGHIVNVVSAIALIAFGSWIAYGGWKESQQSEPDSQSASPAGSDSVASRTALLLILGSSPMIEGIPAFLAASTAGVGLVAVMAVVFAVATVMTYVVTSVAGVVSLRRSTATPVEKFGELFSGAIVAAVGIYALLSA